MRARAVTLRPFPVTEARRDGEVPQFFLCMLTDTPYSKTPGTSMHLHISKECACHSQVLPLASTRPIFLAHFLHPPGGSLHYSVPESHSRRQTAVLGSVPETTAQYCMEPRRPQTHVQPFHEHCSMLQTSQKGVSLPCRCSPAGATFNQRPAGMMHGDIASSDGESNTPFQPSAAAAAANILQQRPPSSGWTTGAQKQKCSTRHSRRRRCSRHCES